MHTTLLFMTSTLLGLLCMDVFVKHDPRVFYVYGSCGGKLKKRATRSGSSFVCYLCFGACCFNCFSKLAKNFAEPWNLCFLASFFKNTNVFLAYL